MLATLAAARRFAVEAERKLPPHVRVTVTDSTPLTDALARSTAGFTGTQQSLPYPFHLSLEESIGGGNTEGVPKQKLSPLGTHQDFLSPAQKERKNALQKSLPTEVVKPDSIEPIPCGNQKCSGRV
jgi:hypothetical protein